MFDNYFQDLISKRSSKPSPRNERPKTRKNIAKPGNNAVHQIPVGKAAKAKFKSLPHSATFGGTPNPKNPKLPKTNTASAALSVNKMGNGVITLGSTYFRSILFISAPEIIAPST